MYTESLFATQKEWSERGLFLLRELLPLMAPVVRSADWTGKERETLGMLLSASARSSESVLLLTAYGQLWDAEVVLRSVIEGTLKLIYLLQNKQHFNERHEEYRHALFLIALLKDHQKAEDLLQAVPNAADKQWKPIRDRLLPDAERQTIKQRYDKSTRAALETRWGFTALIGALSRSGDPAFTRFGGHAHGYSMASHVQHADYAGVSMPLDRDRRSAERRNAIHLAHLARIISDTLLCQEMRLGAAYRYAQLDPSAVADAAAKISALTGSFGYAYEQWMDVEYGQGGTGEDSSVDDSPPTGGI